MLGPMTTERTADGPLRGVRVLDCTRVLSGPICGRMLADLGADVVKIESPETDIMRATLPRVGGFAAMYAQLNAGKRCMGLDLKAPGGPELLAALADVSDVLLENFRPGVLEKLAEMDADNLTVRKKLAKLALDAKDFEGAVRWSREAIYVNVLDPEVHDWYGQTLVALDRHATAVREYEVASELNPDSAEYVYALAQAARDAKQPDKAKAAAEQVLKLDPNHEAAQQLLKELDP